MSSGVTLYKGTYKELNSRSVQIKVWNGEKWRWLHGRLSGNQISEGAIHLSPRLVFNNGTPELHVPVRQSLRYSVYQWGCGRCLLRGEQPGQRNWGTVPEGRQILCPPVLENLEKNRSMF